MDPITTALKKMYEEFPYPPSGAPEQRVGWDARLLLSYGKLARKKGGTLRVLDAGCGRGAGLLGAAMLQPDVEFLGIDINGVALAEAKEQATKRKLGNVRFQEVDLTTLEGLVVPEGGFDVVFSSGVVHHMPSPAAGLQKLREVLAPHGLLQLMVYASDGRAPLYRVVRALDLLLPRSVPLRDRLLVGRMLVQSPKADALPVGPWTDVATVSDTEFVDRYLNVNETSYSVPQVWDLLEGAGLRFLRWSEPADWNLEALLPPPLLELAQRLSARDRGALVEQLCWRPKLELVAAHEGNGPRADETAASLGKAMLCVSPEVRFRTEVRNVLGGQRLEKLFLQIRGQAAIPIEGGPMATALVLARDAEGTFTGASFFDKLAKRGVPADVASEVLLELWRAEVLYAPHAVDLPRG